MAQNRRWEEFAISPEFLGLREAAEGQAEDGKERGGESKEAEARLSELLPPCYISVLMIAAIAQRQAATLTLMVSLI
jgi:hypothetical protein